MNWTKVEGQDKGEIQVYALSTCIWCRRAKELFESAQVAFSYIYVDRLEGEERSEAMAEMESMTSDVAFPLIVHNRETVIKGFQEDALKGIIR